MSKKTQNSSHGGAQSSSSGKIAQVNPNNVAPSSKNKKLSMDTKQLKQHHPQTPVLSTGKINTSLRHHSYLDGSKTRLEDHSMEDTLEIKIPQPYPQSQYFVIEDQSLLNSQYQTILNEKYPARKYLKHNLTSWLRCNKNKKSDINIKLMCTDLLFKEGKNSMSNLELKKLNFNNEVNEFNITSLPDALGIIRDMKCQIIEYEDTNNRNIETSVKFIDELTDENEFYKKKLLETYEKLCEYVGNFGDELLNPHKHHQIKLFMRRWAGRKIFTTLKKKTKENREFLVKYNSFSFKKLYYLKLKSFISLQRNSMIKYFVKTKDSKKKQQMVKKMFNLLKFNYKLKYLNLKYEGIHKKMLTMCYFKQLSFITKFRKYRQICNKKSLDQYIRRLKRKMFIGLKQNTLKNTETELPPSEARDNAHIRRVSRDYLDESDEDDIRFNKFLNSTYNKAFIENDEVRKSKIEGLKKLKKIINVIVDRNALIDHGMKNKKMLLSLLFKRWKLKTVRLPKELEYKERMKRNYTLLFLSKLRSSLKLKTFYFQRQINCVNPRVFFLNHTRKEKYLKELSSYFNNKIKKEIYQKGFFKRFSESIYHQPLNKFKRVDCLFKYTMFFDVCKKLLVQRKHRLTSIKSTFSLKRKIKVFQQRLFFVGAKKRISLKKRQRIFKARMNKSIAVKSFLSFIAKCLKNKLFVFKANFTKRMKELMSIIDEKSQCLRTLEKDNSEINLHYHKLKEKTVSCLKENDQYRQTIINLELKIEEDNKKFNELWEQNLKDIKNLQNTLFSNEKLLEEALKREESIQDKYCSDIENAIKLNKQLNTILAKKNNQMADLKLKIDAQDKEASEKNSQLRKENATIFNEYSLLFEKKNLELKKLEQDKKESKQIIQTLEDQKKKSDFKAAILANTLNNKSLEKKESKTIPTLATNHTERKNTER